MTSAQQFVADVASPVACKVCAHAIEHGHWGLKSGTHCRVCHRSWVGKAECHCLRCHFHFGSPSAADLHDPSGICKPPDETFRKDGTAALVSELRKHGETWVAASRDTRFKATG